MNLLKEYKYAVIVFVTAIIFNSTINFIVYWYFKIYYSPFTAEKFTPLIIVISALIFTLLIINSLLNYFNIRTSQKHIIRISALFCTLLAMGALNLFLDNYNYRSRKISNIDDFYDSRANGITIDNFEIINKAFFYSRLEKKGNKTKNSYYQLFYIYPFKSKNHNFYYALQFEEKVDRLLFEDDQIQYNQFLKKTKDSLKNYNFQQTHHFELINTSENYSGFHEALQNKSENAIFLQPVKNLRKVDKTESVILLIVAFGVLLLCFTLIFFLSNVKKNDNDQINIPDLK